ncbi:urease accessory protein F-like [Chenopodium quinoa]|uniref:urease accessory protein F-like n=1 Tax=Chenopodium quinoa TaxID=63459 RepID=UPI000B77B652|nr:urease accessory protein F-like [Chenopodium quinoa]
MEGVMEENKECDVYPSSNSLEWSLWQLLDSILPTGGFAHSFGLEAAIQSRLVNNPEDLQTFVIQILQNTGSLLLPFVHATSISHDIETWHKLDKMLDAMLTNEVARKASTTQGSALLRIAAAMFTEVPSLKIMREQSLGAKAISFHHAPIFGLVCGLLGISPDISQRAYLFVTLRDVISAATRLNLIGPQGGAVLQHRVACTAEKILMKWKNCDVENACQTAPLIDVVQGCHSYLFARMFCS